MLIFKKKKIYPPPLQKIFQVFWASIIASLEVGATQTRLQKSFERLWPIYLSQFQKPQLLPKSSQLRLPPFLNNQFTSFLFQSL